MMQNQRHVNSSESVTQDIFSEEYVDECERDRGE